VFSRTRKNFDAFTFKDLMRDLLTFQFVTEDEQLAWATRDSSQEWERQRKLQEQEQADLELALALSRQDA
jgi:hypothetical protein